MGFLDETINLLGINNLSSEHAFCYVSASKGMIVEGYKKIYELSQTKITLYCEQGKKIDIFGNNLKIKELSHKEICITGTISSINFS